LISRRKPKIQNEDMRRKKQPCFWVNSEPLI